MNKINCFIIGLGNIAVGYDRFLKNRNKFYTHAKSIVSLKFFNLIGGCDISKKKRDIFSKLYKKPTFSSIDASLSKLKPSLIVLSTPTDTHLECIKKLSKYKSIKFLLCEKPLSYNLVDAKKILEICKKKNIRLFVNYFRISDPSTQILKNILHKKKNIFGSLYYSRGYFNNCSHFFNFFETILGNFKGGKMFRGFKNYKKDDFLCNFYAKFGNAKINFFYQNKKFDQFKFDIHYDQRMIKYRNNGKLILQFNNNKLSKKIINLANSYQLNVYNQLLNFLKKKKYFLCTGKDALKTINNMYKILNVKKI